MRYAQIRDCDIANGAGIRVSLFVQGCTKRCVGCFNPETWDFAGGKHWTKQIEEEFLALIEKDYIQGVTILGGEPLDMQNREEVTKLAEKVKRCYPQKDLWLYSSYTWEELIKDKAEVLNYLDVLIDGPFVIEKKDLTLKFRGSSNQRVIDVAASLEKEKIVLFLE